MISLLDTSIATEVEGYYWPTIKSIADYIVLFLGVVIIIDIMYAFGKNLPNRDVSLYRFIAYIVLMGIYVTVV